jgi:hypothetical protein
MTSSSSGNNSNNNNGAVSGGGDATYNHASSFNNGGMGGGNNNGGIKMSSSNGIRAASDTHGILRGRDGVRCHTSHEEFVVVVSTILLDDFVVDLVVAIAVAHDIESYR